MGNLVYPVLPGRTFGASRIVLPPPVTIRTTPSQREFRARDSLLPRYQYSVPYNWLSTRRNGNELATLVGFYNQVGGPFDSWLYSDPDDNAVENAVFGVGDGTTTQFKLLRPFGGFAEPVDALASQPLIQMEGGAGTSVASLGSFEWDSNGDGVCDGWAVFAGGAGDAGRVTLATRYGLTSTHGGWCQELQINAATNGNDSGLILTANGGAVPVQPGQVMTFRADMWANVTGKAYAMLRLNFQSGGTQDVPTTSAVTAALTWQTLSATFMVPPGAVSAQIAVRGITAVGEYLRVDGLALVPADAVYTPSNSKMALTLGMDYAMAGATAQLLRAPQLGDSLTWSGKFYRRCRFLGDRLDTTKFLTDLFEAKRVEFISVKE